MAADPRPSRPSGNEDSDEDNEELDEEELDDSTAMAADPLPWPLDDDDVEEEVDNLLPLPCANLLGDSVTAKARDMNSICTAALPQAFPGPSRRPHFHVSPQSNKITRLGWSRKKHPTTRQFAY